MHCKENNRSGKANDPRINSINELSIFKIIDTIFDESEVIKYPAELFNSLDDPKMTPYASEKPKSTETF